MSKPLYKVGDKVRVLFFENVCLKNRRCDDEYWKASCPTGFPGTVCYITKNRTDSEGNLYAVQFEEEDLDQILDILKKNPDPDAYLHGCNGRIQGPKPNCGRWILEDAMKPYTKFAPIQSHMSKLRTLLTACHDKKAKQKEVEAI